MSNLTRIDYWRKYNKNPFDYRNPTMPNAVYMICFFVRRRAVLLRKDLTVLCTFETRKAKQLIDQAVENRWVGSCYSNWGIGERPTGYPKEADIIHYIELGKDWK